MAAGTTSGIGVDFRWIDAKKCGGAISPAAGVICWNSPWPSEWLHRCAYSWGNVEGVAVNQSSSNFVFDSSEANSLLKSPCSDARGDTVRKKAKLILVSTSTRSRQTSSQPTHRVVQPFVLRAHKREKRHQKHLSLGRSQESHASQTITRTNGRDPRALQHELASAREFYAVRVY